MGYNMGKKIEFKVKIKHLFVIGIVFFITFVVLKVTGLIAWSWVWVTFPLWSMVLFTLLMWGIGYLAIKAVKQIKKYGGIR